MTRQRITVRIRDIGQTDLHDFHIFTDQVEAFRAQGIRDGFEVVEVIPFTPNAAVLAMFASLGR